MGPEGLSLSEATRLWKTMVDTTGVWKYAINSPQDLYWVTKSGDNIRPQDMDREHRENTLNMVLRTLEDEYAKDVEFGRDRVDGYLTPEQIEARCIKRMLGNPVLLAMWKLNGYGIPDGL